MDEGDKVRLNRKIRLGDHGRSDVAHTRIPDADASGKAAAAPLVEKTVLLRGQHRDSRSIFTSEGRRRPN